MNKKDIPGVRLCINGSRNLDPNAEAELIKALDTLYEEVDKFDYVLTGGAKGADSVGKKWAIGKGLNHTEFPAIWRGGNKLAGKERNWRMVKCLINSKRPLLVTAWDSMSPGTAHMVAACTMLKIPVMPIFNLKYLREESYIEPAFNSGVIHLG